MSRKYNADRRLVAIVFVPFLGEHIRLIGLSQHCIPSIFFI